MRRARATPTGCAVGMLPEPDDRPLSFLTRDAHEWGIPVSRLRSRALLAPAHGLRSFAPANDVVARATVLLPRLGPRQFFSHATAARIWGLPLPTFDDDALHVAAIPPQREPRIPGVVGHRIHVGSGDLTLRQGLPVPSAAQTWAQLGALLCPHGCALPHRTQDRPTARDRARMLHGDDLVIAADHLLNAELVTRDDLVEAITPGARGALSLELAVELARAGVESPKESELRLAIVRGGLPEPAINWTLTTPSGGFVARLDLAYPAYRVAGEYDGRQHASGDQFRRDADRWADIDAQGWTLVRVLSHHLAQPSTGVVARIRRALLAHGWRPTT